MINELIKLANHLDSKGLRKESDYLDLIINKIASVEATRTAVQLAQKNFDDNYCNDPTTPENYAICEDLTLKLDVQIL